MDIQNASSRALRRRKCRISPRLPAALVASVVIAMPAVLERPAAARADLGSIVRAFCLSAFETEMSMAGKRPPEGMASFACDCVEQRLRSGGTIDAARRDCRQATVRRYPI